MFWWRWSWMEALLHEPRLETFCSPLRFLQQLSPQYRTEKKGQCWYNLEGSRVVTTVSSLSEYLQMSWYVLDRLLNVRTQVDHKFHLPFWFYHLFFFHPGCNLRKYLHVISGFKKNKEKKVKSQLHNLVFSSSKSPSCPHFSLLPSLQKLSFL